MPATAAGRVTADAEFTGGLPACRGSKALMTSDLRALVPLSTSAAAGIRPSERAF